MTTIFKFMPAAIGQLGEREIRAICSTADTDLSGEIVDQAGIDLSTFRANPVVLFAHNQELPVGNATAIGLSDGKLTATIRFADAGVSQTADTACALVKSGVLKGISIGFDATETTPMNPGRPYGPQRYVRSKLFEISIVAIPANSAAQVIQRNIARLYAKDGRTISGATEAVIREAIDHHQMGIQCLSELLPDDDGDAPGSKAKRMGDVLALAFPPWRRREIAAELARDAEHDNGTKAGRIATARQLRGY